MLLEVKVLSTNRCRRSGPSTRLPPCTFPTHGPSVSVSWSTLTGVFDENHSHHSHVYILRIENVVAYVFFFLLCSRKTLYVRVDFSDISRVGRKDLLTCAHETLGQRWCNYQYGHLEVEHWYGFYFPTMTFTVWNPLFVWTPKPRLARCVTASPCLIGFCFRFLVLDMDFLLRRLVPA